MSADREERAEAWAAKHLAALLDLNETMKLVLIELRAVRGPMKSLPARFKGLEKALDDAMDNMEVVNDNMVKIAEDQANAETD